MATQIVHAGISIEVGGVLLWAFFVPDTIVSDIKERKVHAMGLLAHYAVFLHALDPTFWFMRGWGKQLLTQVYGEAGDHPQFRELFEWPQSHVD